MLDHPVIQRCQLHKIRNVKDHLPERLRSSVGRGMADAYHAASALEAEAALPSLAQEFDRTHLAAAARVPVMAALMADLPRPTLCGVLSGEAASPA